MKSKNKNSNAKPELNRAAKKQREKQKYSSHACKRMTNGGKQSKQWDIHSKRGSSIADMDTSNIHTVLKFPKYDDDANHSKKRHLKACKKQKKIINECVLKRRFKNTDINDFKALRGRNRLFADHMPSCDVHARYKFGKLLIDESQELYQLVKRDPETKLYFVTIVDERDLLNERGGSFDVSRFKEKIQSAIRTYTSFSAIGVFEVQAIVNYPKDQKGKSLAPHAHLVCWGRDPKELKALKKRAKGFKSKITARPIDVKKIKDIDGDVSGAFRYILKPPFKGKEVDFRKFGKGKKCLYNARRMEKHHHMRLFEIGAKVPIVQTVFGVKDGVAICKRVVAELEQWHKQRRGTMIKLEHRVDPLFEDFYADNKKLKNYKPFTIYWRKPSRRKKARK